MMFSALTKRHVRLACVHVLFSSARASTSTLLLLPKDMFMDSTVRMALHALRKMPHETPLFVESLHSNQRDYATLTLVGDKGGGLHEQINQDRAFVLLKDKLVVSGVLDGHGDAGHFAAEHARHTLLEKLRALPPPTSPDDDTQQISDFLIQAFLEADTNIPEKIAFQGGATCSIVLQYQGKLYFANAGDSQSFLVASIVHDGKVVHTRVVYETRLDTPGDPDERERLKKAGANVRQEKDDEVRVWSQDEDGQWSGLAMSRGLGDRKARAVIADPLVHAIDIAELKDRVKTDYQSECEVNAAGDSTCPDTTAEHVHLFCVSATDGVLDSFEPLKVAEHISPTLYESNNSHPLLALQELMQESAAVWHKEMAGEYRDDMALAIAKVL